VQRGGGLGGVVSALVVGGRWWQSTDHGHSLHTLRGPSFKFLSKAAVEVLSTNPGSVRRRVHHTPSSTDSSKVLQLLLT
jgi:hypothetical protein